MSAILFRPHLLKQSNTIFPLASLSMVLTELTRSLYFYVQH